MDNKVEREITIATDGSYMIQNIDTGHILQANYAPNTVSEVNLDEFKPYNIVDCRGAEWA